MCYPETINNQSKPPPPHIKIYFKQYKFLLRYKTCSSMPEKEKKLLAENPSLNARFLYNCDRIMHNTKLYIQRHIFSIEVLFLIIYTGLNLGLAFFVENEIVTLFVITFLFVLGIERLILHLKSKIEEERITLSFNSYYKEFEKVKRKLQDENNLLKRNNDILKISLRNLEKSKNR